MTAPVEGEEGHPPVILGRLGGQVLWLRGFFTLFGMGLVVAFCFPSQGFC